MSSGVGQLSRSVEQDKAGVTHTHGSASEYIELIYGTALMDSESPEAERKAHDSGKDVTVLVVSRTSANYFDDQRIFDL